MKLKHTLSLRLIIGILLLLFLVTEKAFASCYSIAASPLSHCQGGEVRCTDSGVPYCCTDSSTECQGQTFGNPGTYYCTCQYNALGGEWFCSVLDPDNCNVNYRPDGNTCGNSLSINPCGGNNPSCNLSCIAGVSPGLGQPCDNGLCASPYQCDPNGICILLNTPGANPTIPPYDLCANVPANELSECQACVGDDYTQGVYTAIGCIKNDPDVFIPSLARTIIGIAGGIALLLMLVGAFLVTTAGGDPKKVESGKSTFTSAIIGLLVVIFSAVILQFIGIQVLRLPNF